MRGIEAATAALAVEGENLRRWRPMPPAGLSSLSELARWGGAVGAYVPGRDGPLTGSARAADVLTGLLYLRAHAVAHGGRVTVPLVGLGELGRLARHGGRAVRRGLAL